MKRIFVIIAGTAFAIAGPAVAATAPSVLQAQAQPAAPQTAPQGAPVAPPAGEGEQTERAPLSTEDFVFLAGVTMLFEIEVSRIAVERSKDKEVRALAQRIIADREGGLRELRAAAAPRAAPATLDEDHQRVVKAVAEEDAEEFDESYLGLMIDTHEDAVDIYEEYDEAGTEQGLRGFANSMLPRLREFLTQAQEAHQNAVAGEAGGSR